MHTPRWKTISDAIVAEIDAGKLRPGDHLPSETELAAQWQISRMTAHRAMHELDQQGIVVRKRGVGTVVAPPRGLRLERVAVFLHTRDFLEQGYLAGIRSALPDETEVLFCDIRNDPKREAEYLERMAKTADRIVMSPTCHPQNTPLLTETLRRGARIVCLDSVPENVNVPAVISDNLGASHEAVTFLTRRGHRHIAHFTEGRMYVSSLRERYAGYLSALAEAGLSEVDPFVKQFLFADVYQPVWPVEPVASAVDAMMRQPDRSTAVFCSHDYILSALVQACQSRGIRIPEDLEVVSFSDCLPLALHLPAGVHRIVQQPEEMGRAAADLLCRKSGERRLSHGIVRISPRFYPAKLSGS